MKEYEKWVFGPVSDNWIRDEFDGAAEGWRAALMCVLNNIDIRRTRTIDVQRFIEQELKIWEEEE